MRKVPVFSWVLVAFFFFGGLAFTVFEETRWIGIGQIWMVVAVVMAVVFLGVGGGLKGKFDLGGKFSSGGGSSAAPISTTPPPQAPDASGDAADQLARLERLRESGDLTDAEYQSQRERILSQG